MQRDNEDGKAKDDQDANDDLFVKPDANQNEEAEAERALAVVNKKLTQTLSVGATVNELIQQAVDVRVRLRRLHQLRRRAEVRVRADGDDDRVRLAALDD